MVKNQLAQHSIQKEVHPNPVSAPLFVSGDLWPLLFCALYFAVHFISNTGAIDVMGPQWFYLVILDLVVVLFILARKDSYELITKTLLKNTFSLLYLGFLALAGLSVSWAINPTEGWVCYVRLVATAVAYFNMAILLANRFHLFKVLAQLLAAILLADSLKALFVFFNGLSSTPLTELILSLTANTGNKNIFAASLVVKIPFVFYCIYSFRIWGKAINIIILILATLTIFIVNARSAYLGLLLETVIFLVFCLLRYFKEKKTNRVLYDTSAVLVPLVAAFLLSQVVLTNAVSLQESKSGYSTAAQRISSIGLTNDASSYRLMLWQHAFDHIKQHPLAGCGYGNWKLASIPFEKEYLDDLNVPVHSHNDFLEVPVELGIPGGLLYIALFACQLVYTIRAWHSKAGDDVKLVAVFSLMALAGYFVDALLNFPMERPVMQVFFGLIIAWNVLAFNRTRLERIPEKEQAGTPTPVKSMFALTALLLLLPAGYVTYLTYQSMVVQSQVIPDLNNEPLKLSLSEANALPAIPNLSSSGQPIEAIKGRYYYENKKYDEALALLDKGAKANPYIFYSDFLKAGVYYVTNKPDSAYYYGSKAFYNRPRARTYYQTLLAVCAKRRDTAAITKAFHEFRHYRNEPLAWNLYLTAMLNALQLHSNTGLLAISDSALLLFPGDKNLLQRKQELLMTFSNAAVKKTEQPDALADATRFYNDGFAAFSKGDYATAAQDFVKSSQIHVINYAVYENAAICYFNLKAYTKAIVYFDKVIALKTAHDGKTEFFKALCLINLGKKAAGCDLLQLSRSKNYAAAEAVMNSNCK